MKIIICCSPTFVGICQRSVCDWLEELLLFNVLHKTKHVFTFLFLEEFKKQDTTYLKHTCESAIILLISLSASTGGHCIYETKIK